MEENNKKVLTYMEYYGNILITKGGMVNMKSFDKMTRKELATIVVEDQIKRGIVREDSKKYIIKRILSDNLGTYASKEYLIRLCEGIQ